MSSIATDLILVIFSGLIGGLLARAAKQPLVIGYIFAGILVGPHTGGATVSDVSSIANLADIGAALLLFSLGLEFSIKDIKPIWRIAVMGSAIQVFFTFIYVAITATWLGWSVISSLWLAGAVVSSSTALILRTLNTKGLGKTLSGKVMLGVSILQDLLVIPILIILVSLSTEGITLTALIKPFLNSILFLLLMGIVALRVIPLVFHRIARLNSQELFMLSTISIGLGIGYISNMFGLSMAFGAFVAGLVLSESDYGKKALSEMIPLRDLFGLVFFASIGMLFDPAFVLQNLKTIMFMVLIIAVGKGLILGVVARGFGYRRIIPIAMMLGMIPISEIAFILARKALEISAIDNHVYQIILNIVVVSMVLGPLIAAFSSPIYSLIRKYRPARDVNSINIPDPGLSDHIIIAGGGTFVEYLAKELKALQISFLIIEPFYQSFHNFAGQGFPVIFGEPEKAEILTSAGISKAGVLIVADSELISAVSVINVAQIIRPGLSTFFLTNSAVTNSDVINNTKIKIVLLEKQIAEELAREAVTELSCSLNQLLK